MARRRRAPPSNVELSLARHPDLLLRCYVLGLVGGAPGGTWGGRQRAAKMLVSYMALARMLFDSHALHTPHAWS